MKFKVGDKVKLFKGHEIYTNSSKSEGVVTSVNVCDGRSTVKFDDLEWSFLFDLEHLELVETAPDVSELEIKAIVNEMIEDPTYIDDNKMIKYQYHTKTTTKHYLTSLENGEEVEINECELDKLRKE